MSQQTFKEKFIEELKNSSETRFYKTIVLYRRQIEEDNLNKY